MDTFIGSRATNGGGAGDAPVAAGGDGREPIDGSDPSAGPLRVLVVEDNSQSAEVLEVIITLWGHETRIVHSGPLAIDEAKVFLPDVVLLDIGLPGMDGYAVARTLRREHGFRNLTLVAMTGYGRDEDLRKAAEAGFDHHMLKPLALETLEQFLADLGARTPGATPTAASLRREEPAALKTT